MSGESGVKQDLITRYRPDDFDLVLGQDAVVKSLGSVLSTQSASAFLFTGPSGTGKTTVARITAMRLGCLRTNIIEVDAATHTGIEAMRQLTDLARYRPLGESDVRGIIVDEAHALSSQAWKALLKSIEEPPPGLYWFFCTTEFEKVPSTIRTRCASYHLKLVSTDLIYDLVKSIVDVEKWAVPDMILDLVARQAQGSPRQALVNLSICVGASELEEAYELLRAVSEQKGVPDLCQKIIRGGLLWEQVRGFMEAQAGADPESVRLSILGYLTKVLSGTKDVKAALRCLQIMECFREPCTRTGGQASLWMMLGELVFNFKED